MGFVKGCPVKKSDENCCDPCDTSCDYEADDEQACADSGSSKQACCKPGCSTKKPCVSCIKCGVKPEICRRAPKRTCTLTKSCCK